MTEVIHNKILSSSTTGFLSKRKDEDNLFRFNNSGHRILTEKQKTIPDRSGNRKQRRAAEAIDKAGA